MFGCRDHPKRPWDGGRETRFARFPGKLNGGRVRGIQSATVVAKVRLGSRFLRLGPGCLGRRCRRV